MWDQTWEYFDDKKGLTLVKVGNPWFDSLRVNFPYILVLEQGGIEPQVGFPTYATNFYEEIKIKYKTLVYN